MNSLRIQNLSLTYKNGYKALTNVNLEIGNGIFGLLGPNGAGKSSLMKTIVGLQKPTHGKILFNEVDIVKNPYAIQKHLGFLPQYFGVYPKISAYQLLKHIAILKGMDEPKSRNEQILSLLEKVNLIDAKSREVYKFSGGMKQRFGVAQALLGNPKIIIVDEPTAGLDPEERNKFNALLSDISEDVIVILSTHLVEDIRNLSSSMGIIKQGQIIMLGAPNDFIEDLNGKLWTKPIVKKELLDIEFQHKIISKQLIERIMHITVYAERPPNGFNPVEPTLEHVYFNSL